MAIVGYILCWKHIWQILSAWVESPVATADMFHQMNSPFQTLSSLHCSQLIFCIGWHFLSIPECQKYNFDTDLKISPTWNQSPTRKINKMNMKIHKLELPSALTNQSKLFDMFQQMQQFPCCAALNWWYVAIMVKSTFDSTLSVADDDEPSLILPCKLLVQDCRILSQKICKFKLPSASTDQFKLFPVLFLNYWKNQYRPWYRVFFYTGPPLKS